MYWITSCWPACKVLFNDAAYDSGRTAVIRGMTAGVIANNGEQSIGHIRELEDEMKRNDQYSSKI